MKAKVRFVLNRGAVSDQLLHNTQILDAVQSQVTTLTAGERKARVYRNAGGVRGTVVATVPMSVEDKRRGYMAGVLGKVRI